MEDWPEGAHDRWLAAFSRETVEVWCDNPQCPVHMGGMNVEYTREYGQGSYDPEDCPECAGRWLEDKPEEPEAEPDSDEWRNAAAEDEHGRFEPWV